MTAHDMLFHTQKVFGKRSRDHRRGDVAKGIRGIELERDRRRTVALDSLVKGGQRRPDRIGLSPQEAGQALARRPTMAASSAGSWRCA